MYVCLCNGVNDHQIEAVVRGGAHTVEAVGAACAAGTGCGGCQPEIERIIARMEQRLVEAGHAG